MLLKYYILSFCIYPILSITRKDGKCKGKNLLEIVACTVILHLQTAYSNYTALMYRGKKTESISGVNVYVHTCVETGGKKYFKTISLKRPSVFLGAVLLIPSYCRLKGGYMDTGAEVYVVVQAGSCEFYFSHPPNTRGIHYS